MTNRRQKRQSPIALATVVGLHAAFLTMMLYYQPKLGSAQADVMLVSMITLPQPLPVEAQPEPPKLEVRPVRKPQRAVTPPAPLETASQTAISLPPAPPSPPAAEAETVAGAPAAPPAPPAPPIVLPRFDADYLQNPAPAYPAMARRMGEQGKVLLRVVVKPDGTTDSVTLRQSSGSQRLDEAALEAVRRWRFVPARRGDTPVTAAVIVPIVFSLEG